MTLYYISCKSNLQTCNSTRYPILQALPSFVHREEPSWFIEAFRKDADERNTAGMAS